MHGRVTPPQRCFTRRCSLKGPVGVPRPYRLLPRRPLPVHPSSSTDSTVPRSSPARRGAKRRVRPCTEAEAPRRSLLTAATLAQRRSLCNDSSLGAVLYPSVPLCSFIRPSPFSYVLALPHVPVLPACSTLPPPPAVLGTSVLALPSPGEASPDWSPMVPTSPVSPVPVPADSEAPPSDLPTLDELLLEEEHEVSAPSSRPSQAHCGQCVQEALQPPPGGKGGAELRRRRHQGLQGQGGEVRLHGRLGGSRVGHQGRWHP